MCKLGKREKASPQSGILCRVQREQWCQNVISWRPGRGTAISASQRWIWNLKERWIWGLRDQDLSNLESEARVTNKIWLDANLSSREVGELKRDSCQYQVWRWCSSAEPGDWRTAPSQRECRSDHRPWTELFSFFFFSEMHTTVVLSCFSYPFFFPPSLHPFVPSCLPPSLSFSFFFSFTFSQSIRNELLLCIIFPFFSLKNFILLW